MTGQWDEAVALSTRLLADPGLSPVNRITALTSLGSISARREGDAWTCLDEALAGDCDEQQRGSVAAWAQWIGVPHRLPLTGLAEPYQHEVDGDWQSAARAWTGLGCPFDTALALLGSADEPAIQHALRIFQDLAATTAVRLTCRRMRELGLRAGVTGPRPTTREHPFGLTRHEREVLDFVVEGRTNAEIAARLFISAKAVDHPVSAVLTKLDAPTRNVAAAEAVRLGLVATPDV